MPDPYPPQCRERVFLLAVFAEIEAVAARVEPPLSEAELFLLDLADRIAAGTGVADV